MLIRTTGDQHRGPLTGGDRPQPFGEQGQPIFIGGHEHQVGQAPEDPARQATHLEAAEVGDGVQRTKYRHGAEIGELEGFVGSVLNFGHYVGRHPAAHLHCGPGHARQGFAIACVAVGAEVADDADLWMVWNREVGLHHHPSAPVDGATAGIGQHLAQMGGLHAGGPADGGGFQGAGTFAGVNNHFLRLNCLNPST